jgi:MOSC domain-containing protein YiiM
MTSLARENPTRSTCEDTRDQSTIGQILAVCISHGGVPKWPIETALVTANGIEGDQHAHAKHVRPDRALSLFDVELLRELVAEGFPLEPGTAGENLTISGLNLQQRTPGTVLQAGDVLIRLELPRKPCYVLDKIDPRLQEAIVGRCGFMASVLRGGTLQPGMSIQVLS